MRLVLAAAVAVLVLGCGETGKAAPAGAFVAADGSDTATCTRDAPCASLDRAYHVAASGTTVSVAPGTYPTQEVNADPAKPPGSAPVAFAPTSSGAVVIDGDLVLLGVHDVNLERLQMKQLAILPSTRSALTTGTEYSSNITLSKVGMKLFVIRSAKNVTIASSAIGNYSYLEGYGSNTIGAYDAMPPATGIVIDRVIFRGIRRDTSPSHAECLFLQNVDGIVIRRSRFLQCPVMAIFSQAVGDPNNPQHVLIENNFIGHPGDGGSSSVYVDYRGGIPPTNWQIRFNSFGGGLRFADGNAFPGIVVDSNVGPNTSGYCGSHVTYLHNVWTGVRCGARDRLGATGYVNEPALDFRLVPCASAIGSGDPKSFPATDIFANRRPLGKRPDAGAWEARAVKRQCR